MKTPLIAAAFLAFALLVPTETIAASGTWTNAVDATWTNTANWSASPVPGAGETATFNNAGNGFTAIDIGSGVTLGSLVFDTANASAYTIGAGAAGSQVLTFNTAGTAVSVGTTVASNQTIAAGVVLTNASGTNSFVLSNASAANLVLTSNITTSGAGVRNIWIAGAGNTAVAGAVNPSNTANASMLKQGTGTLTLTGNNFFNGNGAIGYTPTSATYPAVFQGGVTRMAGTNTVTGELVVGGVITTNGGPGADTALVLDGAALNITTWFSIGRGNGVGGVTSSVAMSNGARATASNLSAGFNGATGNLPKVAIAMSNSSLVVTNAFNFAESAGSQATMTLNGASTVTLLATSGSNSIGQVGSGTITVNSGSTFTSSRDAVLGVSGAAQGTVNVNGGTFNIGNGATKWLMLGWGGTASSAFNLSSGALKVNNSSSVVFSRGGNTGGNTFSQNGGTVTFYSDNGVAVGGTGSVNMGYSGSASNTYNLNGGTLQAPSVSSTVSTGTRTFNFNGGTLKATTNSATFFALGTGTNGIANVRNGGATIDDSGFAITVNQALLHSAIAGDNATDGGLTKQGGGTLTLVGTNTYTGPTTVNAGTLRVNGALAGTNAVSVAATAGLAGSGTIAGPVSLGASSAIANGLGTTNKLTVGALTFSGNAAINLALGGTDPALDVVGALTGPGSGTVTINATNGVWSNGTNNLVSFGSLPAGTNNFVLGTVSGVGGRQVLSGGLVLNGNNLALVIVGDSVRWNGTSSDNTWTTGGSTNWTTVGSSSNTTFVAGDMVVFNDLASYFTVNISAANVAPLTVTFSNSANDYMVQSSGGFGISSGSLTKTGTAAVTLSTSNSYSGGTTIAAGKIIAGNSNALGANGSALTFAGAGTLDLNGYGLNLGSVGGSAGTVLNNGAAATLTVTNASDSTIANNLSDGLGALALSKIGAGTLTLSGTNMYSGGTTIGAGALLVAGTLGSNGYYPANIANSGLLYLSNAAAQTFAGNVANGSFKKQGAGSLVMSGTNAFTGAAARDAVGGFPIVLQGGVTRLAGGSNAVTGEMVVGGIIASGGPGVDTSLVVDGGALAVSSWLSVGRGNGVGAATTDLTLSNATVTAGNFSAGYEGAAGNMPKGTVALNGTSSLVITGNGTVNLAESAGSSFAMALAGASTFTASGTGTKYIGVNGTGTLTMNGSPSVDLGTTNGTTYVGFSNSGAITMNGGYFNAYNVSLGGTNSALAKGSVSVNGGTMRVTTWLVLGFNGASTNTLAINGGTVNAGSGANGILLHQQNSASGQINLVSGSLNVWSNASITAHPAWSSGAASAVINQTGGSVTFYSDAGATAGGTGALEMQGKANPTNITTYNLGGGTLTVPRITSSQTDGTRIFNFNGGTIRPTASSSNWFNLGTGTGLARANVRDGGAKIDTAGRNIGLSQLLEHSDIGGDAAIDGGLTKSGNGTLTISAANSYTGPTSVDGGALIVEPAGIVPAALDVKPGCSAVLNGLVGGNVTVAGATVGGAGVIGGSLAIGTNSVLLADTTGGYLVASNGVAITGQTQVAFNGIPISGVPYILFAYGAGGVTGTNNLVSAYPLVFADDAGNQVITATLNARDIVWSTGNGVWTNGGGTNWSGGGPFYAGDNVLFTNSPSAATVTLEGEVLPASVLFDSDTAYTLGGTGSIGGAVALIKSGAGTLTLASSNSYTGGTVLNAGQLNIDNPHALGTGTLTINGGAIDNTSGAPLALATSNSQAWDGDFAFVGSNDLNMAPGAVTLGGVGDRVVTLGGGKTLTVGKITSAGAGLSLAGNGTLTVVPPAAQPAGDSSIAGTLNVGAGTALRFNTGSNAATTADFKVLGLTGSGSVLNGGGVERWLLVTDSTGSTFAGSLSDGGAGALGFAKYGTATNVLSGSNSASGRFTAGGGGTLVLAGPNASTNYGAAYIDASSTLVLAHTNALGAQRLVRFSGSSSTLVFGTDLNGVTHNAAMASGLTATIVSDRLTPGAGITHTISTEATNNGLGGSTINFASGANVTSGEGRIEIPQLSLGAGAVSTTLLNPTNAGVTVSNVWKANNNISQTLGLGGTTADNYVTGTIANGSVLTGTNAIAVEKTGTGTWYLLGTNTYSGPTTVSAGSLFVNGSQAGATGELTVSAGATLGGAGTVRNIVLSGGILSPGASATNIGTLTSLGAIAADASSVLRFKVAGNRNNDAVVASGGLTALGTVRVLLDAGYAPASGDTFDFVAGTITGTPALDLPVLSNSLAWVTNNFLASGVLTITNTTPPGPTNAYGVWLTNYPSLGAYTNATDDPDGDGFDNAKEFAFDGNPTAGTPALLKGTKTGTNMVFTFVANNSMFPTNYAVLSATNLKVGPFETNAAVTATISNSADQTGVLLTNEYTRKEFQVPVSGTEYFRVHAVLP